MGETYLIVPDNSLMLFLIKYVPEYALKWKIYEI